jgi:hypothetical protein
MTIALTQNSNIGVREYLPEGPFGPAGQTPFPSFAPGSVVSGAAESEFVYLIFAPVASVTLKQGDVLVWDNSFVASLSATGSAAHPFGASVGTFFLGGRVGDPAANSSVGNLWSYTFTIGVYGIWVQRAGVSLINTATVNAQTKPFNTTAVAGQVNAPAAALAGSMGITGAFPALTSWAFTGTTATGSAVFTAVSATKGLVKGQRLSGTGVATGSVIADISGDTVTASLPATAAGTVTITAANNSTDVTTTSGSPFLTNVTSIAGIYPNQTIAGTGIPASTTILEITGNQAPYTIKMSANATATANNINATTTIYVEAMLRWPQITVQN